MQDYITIRGQAKASFVEKKSEFIGQIRHVETPDEAIEFINAVRAEHRRARHNVYAYITRDGNTSRYSDDGEPQGTGGVPVLEVLKKEGLTDVCVVVTRYFGGILLGGGGLVRAYSHACKIACEAAVRMEMCSCSRITVTCTYGDYMRIVNCAAAHEAKKVSEDFTSDVKLVFLVRERFTEDLISEITDLTAGTAVIDEEKGLWEDFA